MLYIIILAVLAVIECCGAYLYLKLQKNGKSWKSRTAKMTACTSFLLMAAVGVYVAGGFDAFSAFLFAGLALSWVGDLLLHFSGFKFFVSGASFFLLAHISYIISFIKAVPGKSAFSVYEIIGAAALVIAVLLIYILIKAKKPAGALLPIAVVYGACICLMASKAWSLAIYTGGAGAYLTLGLGSALFLASDFSLLLGRSDKRFKTDSCALFNGCTYFGAQTLLALSVFFIC